MVEGFNWREEEKWKHTYRLWAVQLKDPGSISFERFMGRELSEQEKFSQLWELIEADRLKGENANCTAS